MPIPLAVCFSAADTTILGVEGKGTWDVSIPVSNAAAYASVFSAILAIHSFLTSQNKFF